MKSWGKRNVFGAAVLAAAIAGSAAAAVDVDAVLKDRQATMKQQAKDAKAVKDYIDGKADQAAGLAAAKDLVQTMNKIPDLFPPGTAKPSPDGDYAPKAAIWSDWNKFLSVRKAAAAKTDVLVAAIQGGDKNVVRTAFADLGKNGCGACHTGFREKLKP